MKNIFLYAPRDSAAFRQVEAHIRRIPWAGHLITLPPGSCFTSPLCLELRSNDIIILFALDDEDIDALLELRDEYESFRIILIMNNAQQVSDNRYTRMCPRFVAYLDSSIGEVSEYLMHIFRKSSPQ